MVSFPDREPGRFIWELQVEPGIYFAGHQLLNEFYVQPGDGPDYLDQRLIFTQQKRIREYVLNTGFLVRYSFRKRVSLFIQGSISPMFTDTATERLARGFAFSDMYPIQTCSTLTAVITVPT